MAGNTIAMKIINPNGLSKRHFIELPKAHNCRIEIKVAKTRTQITTNKHTKNAVYVHEAKPIKP